MNLHEITSGALAGVFPESSKKVTVRVSVGYATDEFFKQVPLYVDTTEPIAGRLQSLSSGDIERLNFLNIQGVKHKMYLDGNFEGLVRDDERGGDLILMDGDEYLVSAVLERWPTWCSVALTMQVTQ